MLERVSSLPLPARRCRGRASDHAGRPARARRRCTREPLRDRPDLPPRPQAFTQGLVFATASSTRARASTGSRTSARSSSRTAKCCRRRQLESRYFGEGIALVGDRLIQLTWQSGSDSSTTRTRSSARDVQLHGRGLGPHLRRHARDHERRHADAALPGSADAEARWGDSRSATADARGRPQRTGSGEGRDLRQRLDAATASRGSTRRPAR